MKKKIVKKVILFISFISSIFGTIFLSSCKMDPEPELTPPKVTLTLSETSPQSEIIISWTASKDAQFYSIERTMERDNVVDIKEFSWIEGSPLKIVDATCEAGTEYSYVVTAGAYWKTSLFTSEMCFKKSKKQSITTEKDPNVTLDFPKNVTVEPAEDKTNALTIKWDEVENAAFYEVYEDFGYEKTKLIQTTQTFYTKEHLFNLTSYTFVVRAFNGENCSLFSAKATGKVKEAVNLTKDKAFILENGVRENLYVNSDYIWFKCTPQIGTLSFFTRSYDNECSATFFLEDGTIVASGLPLFILNEAVNNSSNIKLLKDKENYYSYGVIRNIKDDISDFSAGTTYLLRIAQNDPDDFSICVE